MGIDTAVPATALPPPTIGFGAGKVALLAECMDGSKDKALPVGAVGFGSAIGFSITFDTGRVGGI